MNFLAHFMNLGGGGGVGGGGFNEGGHQTSTLATNVHKICQAMITAKQMHNETTNEVVYNY